MTEQWKDGDRAVISIPPFEAEVVNERWWRGLDGVVIIAFGVAKNLNASFERVIPLPVENRDSIYTDRAGFAWRRGINAHLWWSGELGVNSAWADLLERGPLTEYRKDQP